MNLAEELWNLISETLLHGIREHIAIAVSITGVILICSVLKNFDAGGMGQEIRRSAFLVEYGCIALFLSQSVLYAKDMAGAAMDKMVAALNGASPVLLTAALASGSLTTATGMGTAFLLATELVANGLKFCFLPAACLLAALSFVDNLSTEISISNLVDFIKKVVLWGLGFLMTLYLAVLSVQSFLTVAEESALQKTAKFAAGSLIPIVGQYLSDSFDAVTASAAVIHSTTGTGAMITILTLCLAPALELLLLAGILQLASALVQPVADSRISRCISATATAISLMSGLTAVCAAILTITIGAFLTVMANVMGG